MTKIQSTKQISNIAIDLATQKDKIKLREFFKHYGINEIARNRVDCYLSHNFTVVAKNGNEIVGILQWYVKEDPKAGVVEFEEINVREEYRGQGVGSALLDKAIDSVKQYFGKIGIKPRKIYLFVNESNTIAKKLYEKYGFKLNSQVKNLFVDNEVELLYVVNV